MGPVQHKDVNFSRCGVAERGCPSRVRRREKRAAERAAAKNSAAVKFTAEGNAAEKAAAENAAAEKCAAEKCAAEKAAAEKCATAKAAVEKAAAEEAAAKAATEEVGAEKVGAEAADAEEESPLREIIGSDQATTSGKSSQPNLTAAEHIFSEFRMRWISRLDKCSDDWALKTKLLECLEDVYLAPVNVLSDGDFSEVKDRFFEGVLFSVKFLEEL